MSKNTETMQMLELQERGENSTHIYLPNPNDLPTKVQHLLPSSFLIILPNAHPLQPPFSCHRMLKIPSL
jgi:hypothetical protein